MNRPMRGNIIGRKPKLEKGALKYVISRVWEYLKKYPANLAIVILAIIITVAFNLAVPFIIQYFIDNHIDTGEFNFVAVLIIMGGLVLGTILIVVFGYLQTFLMAKASVNATTNIRLD